MPHVIADPASLALLMGVAPADVPLLSPKNGRGNAFRNFDGPLSVGLDGFDAESLVHSESSLRAELGALMPYDAYWLPFSPSSTCDWATDDLSLYLEHLGRTRTFMTNARYDTVVWTDALRAKLEALRGAEYDASSPEGSPRPGVIRFDADDGRTADIRFPEYEAGHAVTISAPREFGEDVAEWLKATGANLGQSTVATATR
jgi:hypothetical protein